MLTPLVCVFAFSAACAGSAAAGYNNAGNRKAAAYCTAGGVLCLALGLACALVGLV